MDGREVKRQKLNCEDVKSNDVKSEEVIVNDDQRYKGKVVQITEDKYDAVKRRANLEDIDEPAFARILNFLSTKVKIP